MPGQVPRTVLCIKRQFSRRYAEDLRRGIQHMAAHGSVEELCRALNKPPAEVHLNCIFCGGALSERDKLNFDAKALCLIWRGGWGPYGACVKCCEYRALADCVTNAQCTLEHDGVEILTGKKLFQLIVRCRLCFGLLSRADKIAAKNRREPYVLVRKCWRGICGACFAKQE